MPAAVASTIVAVIGLPRNWAVSNQEAGIPSRAITAAMNSEVITMYRIAPGPEAMRAAVSALKLG